MQKQEDIMKKLDKEEKLALAASLGAAAEPWAERYGIPRVEFYDYSTENGEIYPELNALAQSWNMQLISDIARDLAPDTEKKGKGLFCLKNMGVKDNPYRKGISEDPYVCAAIAEAAGNGIRKAGMIPCFSGYLPASGEEEFPVPVMREVFLAPLRIKPQQETTAYCECFPNEKKPAHKTWNALFHNALRKNAFVLDECGSDLFGGNILLHGDKGALRTAAEKDGADALDQAAERVIGLALACGGAKADSVERVDREKYALRAAEEGTVLLKNHNGILPLESKKKLAVIGLHGEAGKAFENALKADTYFQSAGFSEGYDLSAESREDHFSDAIRLAQTADAVLLFLEMAEPVQNRALLSANRLAILDELLKRNPNIIVFIPSGKAVDVSFSEKIPALLSADWKSSQSAAAILKILSGKTCPSGRLASSLYCGTDTLTEDVARHKKAGKIKAGAFVSYRDYDTAGVYPPYPFGFGLSYTKFSYSGLKIKDNYAQFTVKNTGKYDAWETVQLYAGKADSAVVRPHCELIGFKKIFLRAGTHAEISIFIDTAPLCVWNGVKNVLEGGEYDIFVSSSVRDVQLKTRIHIAGEQLASDGEHLADYVLEKSNIISGNYTLEQAQIRPVRKRRITMKKTGLCFLIVSILLGILVIIFAAISSPSDMQSLFTAWQVIVVCFLPQMTLAAIVLLIVGRKKKKKNDDRRVKAENQMPSTYVPPEIVEDASYETLFEKAFAETEKKETNEELLKNEENVPVCFDQNLTIPLLCENMEKYFSERGIVCSRQSAEDLLAAMASSRLVVVRSEEEKLLPQFLRTLGEFFATETIVRDISEDGDSLSVIGKIMADAAKKKRQIVLCSWYNVDAEGVGPLLGKYTEYVQFPYSEGASSNVWFVVAMRSDADSASVQIPSAVFVSLEIPAGEAVQDPAPAAAVFYDQFEKLAAQAHGAYCLDEEKCWKKADLLEKYAGGISSFCLGNKDWLRIEMFSAVCCACGAEQMNALDRALSCVILAPMFGTLRKNGVTSNDFLNELLSVFGADGCPQCRKMLGGFADGNL